MGERENSLLRELRLLRRTYKLTGEEHRGAASMNISLSEGVLTVRHSHHRGTILLQGECDEGAWEAIWEVVRMMTDDKIDSNRGGV